jgi:hypothetical protein
VTETTTSRPSDRALAALSVSPAFTFAVVFLWRSVSERPSGNKFTLFDDAFISMTYARTFATTGELSWYEGTERIEGFTNPLWTLYMTALHKLSLPTDATIFAVSITGLVAILGVGVTSFYLAKRLTPNRTIWFFVAAVTSLTYSLVFWSLRGMEVGVFTLTVTLLALSAVRYVESPTTSRLVVVVLLAAAGLLIRTDFVVIAVVVGIWLALCTSRKMFTGAIFFASIVTTFAATFFIRLWYYGTVFPNTYTLKLTGVSVLERVNRGVDTNVKLFAFFLVLSVAGFFLHKTAKKPARLLASLLVMISVATVMYSTYVGGDAWENFPNRYVTPGVITGSVVAVSGLAGLFQMKKRRMWAASLAAIIVLMTTSFAGYAQWVISGGLHVQRDAYAAELAETIKEITLPDAVVAYTTAGIAYYGERTPVDILGKMDPVIAASAPSQGFYPGHNKWDYRHTVETYSPDVIANMWNYTPAEYQYLLDQGYRVYCVNPPFYPWPIFIHTTSTKVFLEKVTPCDEGPIVGVPTKTLQR